MCWKGRVCASKREDTEAHLTPLIIQEVWIIEE